MKVVDFLRKHRVRVVTVAAAVVALVAQYVADLPTTLVMDVVQALFGA
jgi:uncharacterized protein involved in exopolysaccharide biosynthesis